MKKSTIFILFLILILVFSGGLFSKKHQENVEREAFLKEESPRIEQFLKYNYININKVTFTHVKVSPMGIPYIEGYINDDKELAFSASIFEDHFERSISIPKQVGEWSKYEVDKSVTEIQQEKNKNP
ncbi:DUF1433 domain-containing protein [Listeria swaminathanii]|uniref:DUF1433 domain-containing protein n=1 Tax=Listeria swaminathanii TaxID=2713501 RepID=A0ABU2IH18_9LIST|nr:DUF1433 domain-containing protein [Listeria swaminathanii]MDT0017282.1 DUF1433 domain-containing protein [Listeria swaminathanii]MDT0023236.1 DUF1433 domain-containing protein [Listeria swaminathanii]MDT0034178.1 DUF1433 domain-containing protein [Listeria swaminathanii]MDT0053001.1 DUF1433 domain-containing protein [Listeria swaminathanii]MDT0055766.1 DUF1433 domain-containing protein [Listeria swaminathanii]